MIEVSEADAERVRERLTRGFTLVLCADEAPWKDTVTEDPIIVHEIEERS